MFSLLPTVNNLSLTSKQAHVRSLVVIAVPLAVPKGSSSFSLVALLRFPSIREKEKRLESRFYYLGVKVVSLSIELIS